MPYGSRRHRDGSRGRDERSGDRRDARRSSDDRDDRRSAREHRDTDRSSRTRTGAARRRPAQASGRPTVTSRIPDKIAAQLDQDPTFQVLTADRAHWVDPYAGSLVPVGQDGFRAAALAHWRESGAGKTPQEPMSLDQVQMVRWRYDLMRLLPVEPRLRIFGREELGWLNPYSGEWEPTVQRDQGQISRRTVDAMAAVLVHCPYALAGVMQETATLRERQQSATESGANTQVKLSDASLRAVDGDSRPERETREDMQRASEVQRKMFNDLVEVPGYDIGVHYTPHLGVGGDFYETLRLRDGRVLVVLGDVTGHGVQAALVVASVLKIVRLVAPRCRDVSELLVQLNDEIRPDLIPGHFITVFAGALDPEAHRLTAVLAGHHPLVLVNPESEILVRTHGRTGMAVGLVGGSLFRASLKPVQIDLEPGDTVVQYSDALIEGMGSNGEEYGVGRFAGSLLRYAGRGAQALVDATVEKFTHFAGERIEDDITLLALRREPEPEPEEA